ncbi:MAG: nitroreductase family protein [Desulfovibrionaceae bacterium]|nr:nitroreductase family protein [Desulfovibrionaceae bacterium]
MSFAIDTTRCTGCGLCAADCVLGLVRMNTAGLPEIDPSRENSCVHCGHCAAICPEGAVLLDGRSAGELEPAAPPCPYKTTADLLRGRRAVRLFRRESPDRSLIERALALAAYAPTAHNAREVAYTILLGRGKVERLLLDLTDVMERHGMYPAHTASVRAGRDTLFRGAPALVLISAPERVLSETDCATAAAYLELALPSLGLGSCWAGMLLEACARELPRGIAPVSGHKLYAALMIGIPAAGYRRLPYRTPPRTVFC